MIIYGMIISLFVHCRLRLSDYPPWYLPRYWIQTSQHLCEQVENNWNLSHNNRITIIRTTGNNTITIIERSIVVFFQSSVQKVPSYKVIIYIMRQLRVYNSMRRSFDAFKYYIANIFATVFGELHLYANNPI